MAKMAERTSDTEKGKDPITQIKEEVQQEINTATSNNDVAVSDLGKRLKTDIENKSIHASEVVYDEARRALTQRKDEAQQVTRSVVRVLVGIKENVVQPPSKSKVVLSHLAEKAERFSTATASHLQPIIIKYLTQDIALSRVEETNTSFESDLENLYKQNLSAADILKDCLLQSAAEFSLTEDEIKNKIQEIKQKIEEDREKDPARRSQSGTFESDRNEYSFDFLFYLEEEGSEDELTLRALYSQDDAMTLFKAIRSKIENEINNVSNPLRVKPDEEKRILIDQQMSEEIEDRFLLLFDKIIKQIDITESSETSDKVMQENVGRFTPIAVVKSRLQTVLRSLISQVKNTNELDIGLSFYKKYTEERFDLRKLKINEEEIDVPQIRVSPIPELREVSLQEFLTTLNKRIGEQFKIRDYLHNSKYLNQAPAGEHGYWGQAASFAESMKAVDIDTIMLLPDRDIFMTAHRLYVKYIQEASARQDWKHTSIMFSPQGAEIRTEIEKKVRIAVDAIFHKTFEQQENAWRLDRAMSIAVGLAKGVYLNECELAAMMDPPIDQKAKRPEGSEEMVSYYTNDNMALNALNPAHTALRFKPESIWLMMFAGTEGQKQPITRWWKSKEVYERMQEFQKSFLEGKSAYTNKDIELMIDFLPNMGHIGSLESRSSWRHYFAYEGWLQYYKDTGGEKAELDYLQSWKAIENIGYSVILHFSDTILKDETLLCPIEEKDKLRSKEFFTHLYRQYIHFPQSSSTDAKVDSKLELEKEINRIKMLKPDPKAKSIEEKIDQEIKEGKIKKKDRDKEITKAAYKKFVYQSLAGYLRKTSPTKFITMERNRLSKDGTRTWQKLYNDLRKNAPAEWSNVTTFDDSMNDLMIVEACLRDEVTKKMKEYLQNSKKSKNMLSLADFSTNISSVDASSIQRIMTDRLGLSNNGKRISHALAVYKKMAEKYLVETTFDEFALKIEHNEFGFKGIPGEDLERAFLTYRNAGPRVLARCIGDQGKVEKGVYEPFLKLINSLKTVAASHEHNPEPLIKAIGEIQQTLASIHGQEYSYEVAYKLANMCITYFKKDTAARNIFTRWFVAGRPHSVAELIGGKFRGIWEWNVRDIDRFITELERHQIVPHIAYDLKKVKDGKQDLSYVLKYSGKLLRQENGATKKHIALEIMNNYGPIAVLVMLYELITKALKELRGEK